MISFSESMSKNKIEKRIDKGLPTRKPPYEGIQLWLLTHNKFVRLFLAANVIFVCRKSVCWIELVGSEALLKI